MKILHVISSLASGGAEAYVRDLSIQMVKKGHDVCIAYISEAASSGRCAEYEAAFLKQLEAAGVSFFLIGHECRKNPWLGGRRLRHIANEFQPEVIHSHLYYGLFFMAVSFLDIPLLYTHHSHRLGKGRFLYPFFNRLVDYFIGISEDCSDALKKVGVKKITTIYNGVNAERLLVKKNSDRGEIFTAIAVGSLVPPKNFPLLITAINILLHRRPELFERFRLRIAGEGTQRNKLQKMIEQFGIVSQVQLLGVRQDIPELLEDSDVFIMSSDWEGLPIALLEAMMTGVPVVVTDVGACRDVVENSEAGVVVPSRDAMQLANGIEFIIDNPQYADNILIHSPKNTSCYRIEYSAESHLKLYGELLRRPS